MTGSYVDGVLGYGDTVSNATLLRQELPNQSFAGRRQPETFSLAYPTFTDEKGVAIDVLACFPLARC